MKIEFASSIILAALCVSHAALRGSSNVESESRRNRRLPHMVTCDGLKAKEQVPCDQYNPDQPNDEYSPTRPMDNQTRTSEAGVNLTPGTSVGNPGSIPTRPKDEYNPTRPIQVSAIAIPNLAKEDASKAGPCIGTDGEHYDCQGQGEFTAIPASAAAGASTIIRPELKNGKGTKNWPPKPTVSCPAGCFQAGPKTDGEFQKQCEDEDGNTGTQNCSMASIYCSCEGGGHAEYREVCNDCITGGGFGPGKTETPEGDDSFGGGDLDGISSF